jgi:hypothetical protein
MEAMIETPIDPKPFEKLDTPLLLKVIRYEYQHLTFRMGCNVLRYEGPCFDCLAKPDFVGN